MRSKIAPAIAVVTIIVTATAFVIADNTLPNENRLFDRFSSPAAAVSFETTGNLNSVVNSTQIAQMVLKGEKPDVILARSSGCSTGCSSGCSSGCSTGCSTGCSMGCSSGCSLGCSRGCR